MNIHTSQRRRAVDCLSLTGREEMSAPTPRVARRGSNTRGWAYGRFAYDTAAKTFEASGTGSAYGYSSHAIRASRDYILMAYPPRQARQTQPHLAKPLTVSAPNTVTRVVERIAHNCPTTSRIIV
jgi:hypothetical protein